MGFDLVRLRCIRSWREIRSSICSSSGSTGRYRGADIAGQIPRHHGFDAPPETGKTNVETAARAAEASSPRAGDGSAFSSSCSSPEVLFAARGMGHAGGGLVREAWTDGDLVHMGSSRLRMSSSARHERRTLRSDTPQPMLGGHATGARFCSAQIIVAFHQRGAALDLWPCKKVLMSYADLSRLASCRAGAAKRRT